jgi:hypothetical protein
MKMMCWDITSFIVTEHTDLLDLRKSWITDIDCRNTRHHSPMFTSSSMRLERETFSWVNDEFFYLIEWTIFEDIVDSPWTISYFEISAICHLFWEFCDFFIKFFFIFFVLYFFDHVTRVVCLRTKSINHVYSFMCEKLCFWDIGGESIPSLGKDDFFVFSTRFCLINKCLKTHTDTPILIYCEKYSIHRLE